MSEYHIHNWQFMKEDAKTKLLYFVCECGAIKTIPTEPRIYTTTLIGATK